MASTGPPTRGGANRLTALALLRRALADPSAEFHPGQWEAIDALVNVRGRQLVVERTGWGKSAVYFIATRMLRDQGWGPTLIVSPLLALMRNQINSAKRHGVHAIRIDSTNEDEWPELTQTILDNRADALLVSPERLANEAFMQKLFLPVADRLGLFVIDEAHCISDWGHDFRPDYQRLRNIVRRIPRGTPVLATTATANDRVVRDVSVHLGELHVQRGPLMRKSLALQTVRLPTQAQRLAWLSECLPELPGTGIVYTLTKADAQRIADWLNGKGINVRPYYSGIKHDSWPDSNAYRQRLEIALESNEVKALIATTALGMGYDKPDLGFVVHYQAPSSVVAYYQQVGRAGRGIDHAVGVLMHGTEDSRILDYFRRTAFPDEEWVQAILDALASSDGISTRALERDLNLRYVQIQKALKFLSVANPAPIIKEGATWRRTPVPYRMDREHIQRLTRQREAEWAEMQRYVDERGCLMRFLANALDDEDPGDCGKCASCLGHLVVDSSVSQSTVREAEAHLRHSETAIEPKKQIDGNAFQQYPWQTLPPELRHEEGRFLSRWGDASLGADVADDKSGEHFRPALAQEMAEMVQKRWRPDPLPQWVTCIPSRARLNLVPDFAQSVAQHLGLPFHPSVAKVRDNEPQKSQQNRFHQCRNLDGVFAIDGRVPKGPVLLLDDIVDSGWTLAVAAALLRQAGSGPVYPAALASSAPGS